MTASRALMAAMATAILLGSAAGAHAQGAKRSSGAVEAFAVRGDFDGKTPQFAPQSGGKALKWDAAKGRWGVKLDVGPASPTRDITAVEAGAYYKLTPSLRVGGAVGVADPDPANLAPRRIDQPAPRVKLETAFKF